MIDLLCLLLDKMVRAPVSFVCLFAPGTQSKTNMAERGQRFPCQLNSKRGLLISSISILHLLLPTGAFTSLGVARGLTVSPIKSMSGSASVDEIVEGAPKRVVIAGAGVIGLSTAYYLKERYGVASTLVDPSGEVAPAASGKAGGFLALDWNDYSPVGQLARRSFDLHQELANKLGAENLQYRRLTCASISVNSAVAASRPKGKKLQGVEWAGDDQDSSAVLGMRPLGDEDSIAQVHPKRLCENLWNAMSQTEGDDGAKLVRGKVSGPVHTEDGKLLGVRLEDGNVLDADAVVFACGPWTANVMTGVKYHSVVIPTPKVLSQCVFFSGCGDPEVYVRPDSTAYCTGFPDGEVRVTEEPGHEEVRPEAVDRIVESVRAASGSDRGSALHAEPTLSQACYLPTTPDGLPMMGKLPKSVVGGDGCFVATGHSCWGILLGPATGESMATLIATGNPSSHVDMRPYDPSRFGQALSILESL